MYCNKEAYSKTSGKCEIAACDFSYLQHVIFTDFFSDKTNQSEP